ncbi:hypothetical protein NDU88_004567 [Pleurodeles waltl]|uniref:Uncharacterized protein n=1 Tax=Pleurodeles waltl TaxID=8319 RepID=A0AAV7V3C9_PLEWA|nr:hypothetical protein NDU88_004567 [Pleurodeles waltl]
MGAGGVRSVEDPINPHRSKVCHVQDVKLYELKSRISGDSSRVDQECGPFHVTAIPIQVLPTSHVMSKEEVTTPAVRIAGSEQGKRDSDEVWRQRQSKDGAEQGALSVFVYCRDQALSVSVRRAQSVFVCRRERALSVSVYRRDSRIE